MRLTAAQVRQLQAKIDGNPPAAKTAARKLYELNRTEQAYLEKLLDDPDIIGVWPHGIRVVLGDNLRYEPDFLIQRRDGTLEIHETKHEWSNGQRGRDDSRAKIKMTASLFPFPVVVASQKSKKNGGGWHIERFEPTRRVIERDPTPYRV